MRIKTAWILYQQETGDGLTTIKNYRQIALMEDLEDLEELLIDHGKYVEWLEDELEKQIDGKNKK